jgi:hypothetical protein
MAILEFETGLRVVNKDKKWLLKKN